MEKYLLANQRHWDLLTQEHARSDFYDLAGFKAGKDRLRSIELAEMGNVEGKTLLHLQCHFGLDTLAWARRGAIVTGVDFSHEAIDLANNLSVELNIPAQFICSDVNSLPNSLTEEFDIVYTSYGVLHWLPDLKPWGSVIARFLKEGGLFYIVEDHPLFRIFRSTFVGELRAERSYFYTEEPQRIEEAGSYAAQGKEGTSEYYVWDHTVSEVLNSLIGAGLAIEFVHEFPYAARAKFPFMLEGDDGWWRLPLDTHGTIPFLFSLQARKPH